MVSWLNSLSPHWSSQSKTNFRPGGIVRRPVPMKPYIARIVATLILASTASLPAETLVTRFVADPFAAGWQATGNTNLFTWNASNESLQVTWDSSQPNSYFHHPLGQTLTRTNDFLIRFDLNLDDIAVGTTEGRPYAFQIALGLLHHSQLTNASLARGSGWAPNIVEFDYFPNDVNNFGASISTALISSDGDYWTGGFTFPLELHTNTVYGVQMIFTAANQTLHTTMTSNGIPVGPLVDATIDTNFSDFAVDTVAISSYSDEGQFPGYEGSVLAHGTVDNLAVATPLPVGVLTTAVAGQVAFQSDASWHYTLEATTNLTAWNAVSATVPGNNTTLVLQDTNAPAGLTLYRVRAELP
jgi:hypothetical protein